MTPEDELMEAVRSRRVEALALLAWRGGPGRILDLMQVATRLRAMDYAHGFGQDVAWESVLAQMIAWHHEVPLGVGRCREGDAVDVALAAVEACRTEDLVSGVATGAYLVRRRGDAFRVRHRWNTAVEVADMHLERAAAPRALPGLTSVERSWIRNKPVASRVYPPLEVLRAAAGRAMDTIEDYRTALPEGYLPDTFLLDGDLTVGDVAKVLSAVMGLASLCEETAEELRRTETTLARFGRERLLELVSEVVPSVARSHIDLTVERLTFRAGRSARTSPLVDCEGTILLSPPLITPRAIDALVLRGIAGDPARYGPVGQRQGARAVAWSNWLARVPGALVAERVPARRPDGRPAGDLDVVAVDPSTGRGLCLEVKWPIDAVTLSEVHKTEDWVQRAAVQLDRLRVQLLAENAVAEFPAGWPSLGDVTWTWAVATPQQLCLRPLPVKQMHSTSLRYVVAHGSPRSLDDVIEVLERPDLPAQGTHFEVRTQDFRLGRHRVVRDVLVVREDGWTPTAWG